MVNKVLYVEENRHTKLKTLSSKAKASLRDFLEELVDQLPDPETIITKDKDKNLKEFIAELLSLKGDDKKDG